MRHRQSLRRLASLGVAVLFVSFLSARPAPAAVTALWSAHLPDWGSSFDARNPSAWAVRADTDGNVVADMQVRNEGGASIFDSTGAALGTVPGVGRVVPSGNPGTWIRNVGSMDADNNPTRGAVELVNSSGQTLWSHDLGDEELPKQVVVGGQGVAFVVYGKQGGLSERIIGLALANGAVEFDKSLEDLQLPTSFYFATRNDSDAIFAPTPQGAVAVAQGNAVQIASNGNVSSRTAFPTGYGTRIAVDPAGDLLAIYQIRQHPTNCYGNIPMAGHATLIGADGSIRWSKDMGFPGSDCGIVTTRALPNGLWALVDQNAFYSTFRSLGLDIVRGIDPTDGSVSWRSRPADDNTTWLAIAGVDTTGHLYLRTGEASPGCSCYQLVTLSDTNGVAASGPELPAPESDPYPSLTFAPGLLFALGDTDTVGGPPQLLAISVPGAGSDYPAVFNSSRPPTGGGGSAASDAGGPPPPAPLPDRYVALGDSFSSGEGAIDNRGDPSFDPQTAIKGTNECHRSANAYPWALRKVYSVARADFAFRACSGALIANFVETLPGGGGWNEGPQLDAIAPAGQADPTIKHVTLSVGGNDAGFPTILRECVQGYRWDGVSDDKCISDAQSSLQRGIKLMSQGGTILLNTAKGTWSLCTRPCSLSDISPRDRVVAVPSLAGLYKKIHARAPNAAIRVLLYPHLFGSTPPRSCRLGTFQSFNPHTYTLSGKVIAKLNDLGDKLDTTIEEQMGVAASGGIDIKPMDARTPLKNHGLCDSDRSWINGLSWDGSFIPNLSFINNVSPFSFHPNAAGQAAFATAPVTPLTVPATSKLGISPSSFVAEPSGPSARSAVKKGTTVSFKLNRAATMVFTVQRPAAGRTVKRNKKTTCNPPSRKNRKSKKCTRFVTLKGSFSVSGVAGTNKFHFTGRLGGKKLAPGKYRLVGTPKAGKKTGTAALTPFRIVP